MSSNLKVNTILPSTGTAIGIGTASGNIDVLGHIVGHNTPNLSGINSVTANTFYGSGANLTGLSGVSVANQADNRLITATGTTDALNGESGATYDGSDFTVSSGRLKLTDESSGAQFRIGAGNDFQIEHDGSNTYLYNITNDLVIQNDANVKITAKTGGTERFKVDSSGNATVSNGNLIIGTSGKGIDFSAQTASSATGASTSAEILDHYEEGTWTPTLVSAPSGASIPTHTGYYIKVGNLCTLWLQGPTISGNNSSNDIVRIGGIPFNCATGFVATGIPRGYGVYRDSNHTWVTMLDSGNNIMWGQLDEGVSWTMLKYSGLQNTSGHVTFQITLTYKTT